MPEVPSHEKQSVVLPEKSKPEAVGVRILGRSDPRTMTREQFNLSPDLLFHGTPRSMRFSPKYDCRSSEHITDNDGSTTLGFGFYTTDDPGEARSYSLIRQAHAKEGPMIVSILPYEARVLDLRQKNELTKNAPVSREFAQKWKDRFLHYLQTRSPREGNVGIMIDDLEQRYETYLNSVLELDEIDLRVLLGTAPSRQVQRMNYPSPPWTTLFSDFMIEEGYDGLVYNEGGEGQQFRGGPSYVFYNLEKIGTYESWHE